MMSSSGAHHHRPLTKPTTQDYIASSTRSIERAEQSARAGLGNQQAARFPRNEAVLAARFRIPQRMETSAFASCGHAVAYALGGFVP
jgi:hypothetical protein